MHRANVGASWSSKHRFESLQCWSKIKKRPSSRLCTVTHTSLNLTFTSFKPLPHTIQLVTEQAYEIFGKKLQITKEVRPNYICTVGWVSGVRINLLLLQQQNQRRWPQLSVRSVEARQLLNGRMDNGGWGTGFNRLLFLNCWIWQEN